MTYVAFIGKYCDISRWLCHICLTILDGRSRKKDKIVANSVILLYNGKCEFKQIVKFKKSGVKINGKY